MEVSKISSYHVARPTFGNVEQTDVVTEPIQEKKSKKGKILGLTALGLAAVGTAVYLVKRGKAGQVTKELEKGTEELASEGQKQGRKMLDGRTFKISAQYSKSIPKKEKVFLTFNDKGKLIKAEVKPCNDKGALVKGADPVVYEGRELTKFRREYGITNTSYNEIAKNSNTKSGLTIDAKMSATAKKMIEATKIKPHASLTKSSGKTKYKGGFDANGKLVKLEISKDNANPKTLCGSELATYLGKQKTPKLDTIQDFVKSTDGKVPASVRAKFPKINF